MKVLVWNLRDELRWLLFWLAGTGAWTCFVVALYPAFGEAFADMVSKVPLMKVFMGQFAYGLMDRSLLNAFLGLEFFSWFGVFVGIYPLIFTSSAIAGEVEGRTMEMLLAQPISRSSVLLGKFAAISINLGVLCAATFFILGAAIAICVQDVVSVREYIYVLFNTYLLLITIAGIGFLCSVLIHSQRAALSVSLGFVLFSFILYEGLSIVGVAQWLTRLSPFYYADATKILATGKPDWGDNAILALVAVAFVSAALALFRRKDIVV